MRISNSQERVSNSQERVSNSQERVSNSQERVSNSQERVSNSQERVSNDILEKSYNNKQKNCYINHISIDTAQFRSTMVQTFNCL